LSTRDYSKRQETEIAKKTGGKVQSNSGGTRFGGGDVHTQYCFIEGKTPMKPQKNFTIQAQWVEKAREQAFEQGKQFGIIAFRFDPNGDDFYVLDERAFNFFRECLEKGDESDGS
jgi:hypothetical protein